MHILLVADGRSPTTRSYTEMLQTSGFSVSLASTYPCEPLPGLQVFEIIPVAFGRFARSHAGAQNRAQQTRRTGTNPMLQWLRSSLYPMRTYLGPLTTNLYWRQYSAFLNQVKPDLVHALRIPFEGMLASQTPKPVPLVVSIWGNDLTLHANTTRMMHAATLRTLQRADGLMADTQRDIRLAKKSGFRANKPELVIPGSGGLRLDKVCQPRPDALADLPERLLNPKMLVVNPRGFRPGSVRNDTFFRSIPLVLKHIPEALFACSAMQDQPEANAWVQRLGIRENVVLLPRLSQETMWALFRLAQVSVSVSQHDGTPNSLLEAMACGCFPVAGDIEPLREWISHGKNGLLVDPSDPQALASAVQQALGDPEFRKRAAEQNRQIVETRASLEVMVEKTRAFYTRVGNITN